MGVHVVECDHHIRLRVRYVFPDVVLCLHGDVRTAPRNRSPPRARPSLRCPTLSPAAPGRTPCTTGHCTRGSATARSASSHSAVSRTCDPPCTLPCAATAASSERSVALGCMSPGSAKSQPNTCSRGEVGGGAAAAGGAFGRVPRPRPRRPPRSRCASVLAAKPLPSHPLPSAATRAAAKLAFQAAPPTPRLLPSAYPCLGAKIRLLRANPRIRKYVARRVGKPRRARRRL